uniref:Uncharacterized protein n=1 Tax=Arundo donax TaxID=35708 RepID=A0A0A9D605_ARUDO
MLRPSVLGLRHGGHAPPALRRGPVAGGRGGRRRGPRRARRLVEEGLPLERHREAPHRGRGRGRRRRCRRGGGGRRAVLWRRGRRAGALRGQGAARRRGGR